MKREKPENCEKKFKKELANINLIFYIENFPMRSKQAILSLLLLEERKIVLCFTVQKYWFKIYKKYKI